MSNTDSRDVQIRKSAYIVTSWIELPLSFLHPQFGYSLKKISHTVPGQGFIDIGEYPSGFPYTIQEYYWIFQGNPGTDAWHAIGRLNFGPYFYYTAYCYDTPKLFADRGEMNISVSYDYSKLIEFALTFDTYSQYISETIPIPNSNPSINPSTIGTNLEKPMNNPELLNYIKNNPTAITDQIVSTFQMFHQA
jgi:hypothetical protein